MRFFKRLSIVILILAVLLAGALIWSRDKYVVPIMMYHRIDAGVTTELDTVSPEVFELQMAFLKTHGYHILSVDELVDGLKQGKELPRNSVVITFDDGYENNFLYAFPVLKKYQFPAMFFISPGRRGTLRGNKYLELDQIKIMLDGGMDFGSHGMTQAYLPDSSEEEQLYEIQESKRVLEQELGVPIEYFAYPIGGFGEGIKDKIKEADYKAAFATNRGHDRFNKDLYEINRIKFSNKNTSRIVLWAKLHGYYNLFRRMKKPY